LRLFSCSTFKAWPTLSLGNVSLGNIAQVVLFLFLGRRCVLMGTGDCMLYSRGCTCRKVAGLKRVIDDDIARWIF
jgi:hypothetical protein